MAASTLALLSRRIEGKSVSESERWRNRKTSQGTYNDDQPMWVGDKIYFIQIEPAHTTSMCMTFLQSKQAITSYEQYGIRWTAAGGA